MAHAMRINHRGGPSDHRPAMLQFGHADPEGGSSLFGMVRVGCLMDFAAGFMQPLEWRLMQTTCTLLHWQFDRSADPEEVGLAGSDWPVEERADPSADDQGSEPSWAADTELEYRLGLLGTPPASPCREWADPESQELVQAQGGPSCSQGMVTPTSICGDSQEGGPFSPPASIGDSELEYRMTLWDSPWFSQSIDWATVFHYLRMDPQADSWLCSVLLLSNEVMVAKGFFMEEEDVPTILKCCTVVHDAVARTPVKWRFFMMRDARRGRGLYMGAENSP